MADPFEAMFGLGIEDDERMRQLAGQLRGRQQAADMFALSSVPQIASGAVSEGKNVMSQAQNVGGLRKALADRRHQEMMQQDRQDFTQSQYDQQRRDLLADRAQQEMLDFERSNMDRGRELEDRDYERDIELADRDAKEMQGEFTTYIDPQTLEMTEVRIVGGDILNSAGVPVELAGKMKIDDYNDMMNRRLQERGSTIGRYGDPEFEYTEASTQKDKDYEKNLGERLEFALRAEETYKPEYQAIIPGVSGGAENWVGGALPMASERTKGRYDWWRDWKRFEELEQRHELFGSALTKSEQEEWRASTIGPNTSAEQVQKFLRTKARLARRMAEYEAARWAREGRDPARIINSFGGLVDVRDLINRGRLDISNPNSFWYELEKRKAAEREQNRDLPTWEADVMDKPVGEMTMEELRAAAGEG